MKINWGLIRLLVIVVLIIFLYGFSNTRNEARNLKKIEIDFLDESALYITEDSVNKLLIVNKAPLTSIGKETLVLNRMEDALLKNSMIKNAEVYITIDGLLGVKIAQRKPIARVLGTPNHYVDEKGRKMPLSSVHSARVPIITGEFEEYKEITDLILKINEDEFMKECVIGLEKENDGSINLRIRKNDFKVLFGTIKDVENKFQNFKAFYKLAKQNNMLSSYNLVSLKYNNQVVATKRISNGK